MCVCVCVRCEVESGVLDLLLTWLVIDLEDLVNNH